MIKKKLKNTQVFIDIKQGWVDLTPLCCVAWYSFFWDPFYKFLCKIGFIDKYHIRIDRLRRKTRIDIGYIPCPLCLHYGRAEVIVRDSIFGEVNEVSREPQDRIFLERE